MKAVRTSSIHSPELTVPPHVICCCLEKVRGQQCEVRLTLLHTAKTARFLMGIYYNDKDVNGSVCQTKESRHCFFVRYTESLKDWMHQSNRKSNSVELVRFDANSAFFINIQRLNKCLIALRMNPFLGA